MIEPAKFAKHHIPEEHKLDDTQDPDITIPSQRSCKVVRPQQFAYKALAQFLLASS